MGMGHAPVSSWTISEENLKKICPKTYKTFIDTLDTVSFETGFSITLEGFAESADKEEYLSELGLHQEDVNEIQLAFDYLCKDFVKKTKVKSSYLQLDIGYHNPEDGDIYDDVSGVYFFVSGVENFTPAGKKFKDLLEFSSWVIYG